MVGTEISAPNPAATTQLNSTLLELVQYTHSLTHSLTGDIDVLSRGRPCLSIVELELNSGLQLELPTRVDVRGGA